MKQYFCFLLALASWMILSCSQELDIEPPLMEDVQVQNEEQIITIKASIADADDTKTAVQSDGTSIYWTPGDAINLFYGTASAGQFTTAIESPALTTEFSGTLSVATGTSTESGVTTQSFWGVYPFNVSNTCTGDGVTLTIPSTQSGVAGSFADKLNPSVATSPGLSLAFYNVGSWFIFSVTQDDIVSVTLRGHNNEDLAGRVKVTMDPVSNKPVTQVLEGQKSITMTPEGGTFEVGESYYMVVIPGRMSSGLELTLTKSNGKQATWSINSDVTFTRSMYLRKLNADSGLSFEWIGNISFADNAVKAICVSNWDTDEDGELSYEEAAAVTSIGTVFRNNTAITSFNEFQYFTNTLIPDNAFRSCANLSSIILPGGAYRIGSHAFRDCTSLGTITIPINIDWIGSYAFMGSGLNSLVFDAHSSSMRIDGSAFADCNNLTDVDIKRVVDDWGTYAFGRCTNLKTVSIRQGTNHIGSYVFYDCSSLETVNLPHSIGEIELYAFRGCSKLNTITIPSPTGTLGNYSFSGCSNLGSVIFGEGTLTTIGNYTFQGCTALSSITIPDSVTRICDGSFKDCTDLGSIVISSGISQIGSNPLMSCTSLLSITVRATVPPSLDSGADTFTDLPAAYKIYVPAGSVSSYKSATGWSGVSSHIFAMP